MAQRASLLMVKHVRVTQMHGAVVLLPWSLGKAVSTLIAVTLAATELWVFGGATSRLVSSPLL